MDQLILPTRYEVLERTASQEQADLTRVIERIPAANQHIQELFLRMQQTRVSRFEVLFALSGAGKTTFIESLPLFFDNLIVRSVPPELNLRESVMRIREIVDKAEKDRIIVYFGGTGRDNPTEGDEDFYAFSNTFAVTSARQASKFSSSGQCLARKQPLGSTRLPPKSVVTA